MDTKADDKKFKCSFCEKGFRLKCTLTTHLRTHTGQKPFSCAVCRRKFSQAGHLKEHFRTHTGERPFQCAECGKAYKNGSHLRSHMRSHSKQTPYSCQVCHKSFAHLNSLKLHSNKHTGGKLYRYVAPSKKSGAARHRCSVCGACFKLAQSLKVHLLAHAGQRAHVCQVCSKGFVQSSHLNEHMSIHGEGTRHACSVCGRVCGSAALARRHARSHSLDSHGVYRCTACGERFNTLGSLKTHARRHTGEKAYKCGVCSRSFSTGALLVSHMRTHSTHRPFQCHLCSKCFKQRSVLTCHLKMHSNDKRYVCDICTKKFISQSDLVKHRRIHTGEKPFTCQFCNSCFGRSNHLNRHIKIHFKSKKSQNINDHSDSAQEKFNSDITNNAYIPLTDRLVEEPTNYNLKTGGAFNSFCGTEFSSHNRYLNNGMDNFMNFDTTLGLEQEHRMNSFSMIDSQRFNGDIFKYHSDFYGGSRLNIQNFDHRNNSFEERHDVINFYKNIEDNFKINSYDQLKCSKFESAIRAEKIIVPSEEIKAKINCKWRYPNTGVHLKNSCKEVDSKMANNCKPWQCGLCDSSFTQQNELIEHVNDHKMTMPSIKYTRLVTNPESGILEEKEVIPRHKLKVLPEEAIRPIIDTHFSKNLDSSRDNEKIQRDNQEDGNDEKDSLLDTTRSDFEKDKCQDLKSSYKIGVICKGSCDYATSTFDFDEQNKDFIKSFDRLTLDQTSNDVIDRNDTPTDSIPREINAEDIEVGKETALIDNIDELLTIEQPEVKIALPVDKSDAEDVVEHDYSSEDNVPFEDFKAEHKEMMKINKIKKKSTNHTVTKSADIQEKSSNPTLENSTVTKKAKKSVKQEGKVKEIKKFQCAECQKTFKSSYALGVHMRCHSGERPFPCPDCGKTFSQSGHLQEHRRTHTSPSQRELQCQHCGNTFLKGSHLKAHMKRHTSEKSFECEVCRKRFRHKVGWSLHLHTHSGDTPYKCELCGKGFRQPSTLRTHQRTHSGERPYSCSICRKSFSQRSTLASHLLTHSDSRPHSCDHCSKAFRTSGDLNRHAQIHSGVRNFACTTNGCTATFVRKAHLTRHLETHRIVTDIA